MSGDYSRQRFDPKNDFSGVLQQQGRVQLDADWNELIHIYDRRMRAETIDIMGESVVPKETPEGFQIQIVGGNGLTIGHGRIYVDGLLAENHGRAPLEFDPVLAEQRGSLPVPYNEQPYLPNAPMLPEGGPHLVYVDVWEREVTSLEDPNLIEKAVGVDTTTRLQTVWQVKVLPNVGAGATCDTPIPAWSELTAPSDGRLSTAAVGVSATTDPCLIPPSGGYRGLENRLYRLEIHDGGLSGTATFKYSRDNASVSTIVTTIRTLDTLTVTRIGRDSVMRFSVGDWIEVTDDWMELARQPGINPPPAGVMVQIRNVDDTTQTITLNSPLPATAFPTDAQGNTDPVRHTRIRRWDQRGQVRDTNGNLLADLNAPGSKGVIPVPVSGTSIILEDGVQVTFDTPASGTYHIGDYWNFAARTADASVDELESKPPEGDHHFSRLAMVAFPSTITDCRKFWPPSIPEGGDNCACTVCVTPQAHASGQLTVQSAIDQVIAARGGTVCLGVGDYELKEPVRITDAQSVKLVGKGLASQLVAISSTGALVIGKSLDGKSQDIVLDNFSIRCSGTINSPQEAVRVVASSKVRIEHVAIGVDSKDPSWAAIGLADALMTLNVSENSIQAPIGIRSGGDPTGIGGAGLADVRIENNEFDCTDTAIAFASVTVHQLLNRIYGNRINGCVQGGLLLNGVTAPGFGLEVQANVFGVLGHGVVAGLNGLRLLDNDFLQPKGTDPKEQCGVWLTPPPPDHGPITDCHILGNRIQGFDRAGIRINAPVDNVMIKQNQITRVGTGLMLESRQVMEQVSIENNQFNDFNGIAIMGQGEGANYAATGNQIHTRSSKPAVMLKFSSGDGIFSHNECYLEGIRDTPDVILQSSTLIVGNNRVVGSGIISVDIKTDPKSHYTVLGNICSGKIMLDDNGISSPWAPLNLQDVH
jgi:hypothetical protein